LFIPGTSTLTNGLDWNNVLNNQQQQQQTNNNEEPKKEGKNGNRKRKRNRDQNEHEEDGHGAKMARNTGAEMGGGILAQNGGIGTSSPEGKS
jgi:hypothetical protein